MNRQRRFISLEGGEGAGKSTLLTGLEADAFFERVRQTYREHALAEPRRFRAIDVVLAPEQAAAEAIAATAQLFEAGR